MYAFKISTDYAVRIVLYLAKKRQLVQSKELSEQLHIRLTSLQTVVRPLRVLPCCLPRRCMAQRDSIKPAIC